MKILGCGAVVWDDISHDPYANGPQNIGGALLNTVVHTARLGAEAFMLTALGNDELGHRSLNNIKKLGVNTDLVKFVDKPTNLVRVKFNNDNDPVYFIDEEVSWDYITLKEEEFDYINRLRCDVFCFGTLEQRNNISRNTIASILNRCSFGTVFVDLNMREPFYTKEILVFSLSKCNVAKMNMHEALIIKKMFDINTFTQDKFMELLSERFDIGCIVITDGENGAHYYKDGQYGVCSCCIVNVLDTVGAGDAFSAGLLTKLTQGCSVEEACSFACRMGSLICSKRSSIPEYDLAEICELKKK